MGKKFRESNLLWSGLYDVDIFPSDRFFDFNYRLSVCSVIYAAITQTYV